MSKRKEAGRKHTQHIGRLFIRRGVTLERGEEEGEAHEKQEEPGPVTAP